MKKLSNFLEHQKPLNKKPPVVSDGCEDRLKGLTNCLELVHKAHSIDGLVPIGESPWIAPLARRCDLVQDIWRERQILRERYVEGSGSPAIYESFVTMQCVVCVGRRQAEVERIGSICSAFAELDEFTQTEEYKPSRLMSFSDGTEVPGVDVGADMHLAQEWHLGQADLLIGHPDIIPHAIELS